MQYYHNNVLTFPYSTLQSFPAFLKTHLCQVSCATVCVDIWLPSFTSDFSEINRTSSHVT